MFKTIRNAWALPDLRKKLLFTLFIIIIFRIGSVIPVPFLNPDALRGLMDTVAGSGSALGYLDMLSGGAFARCYVICNVNYSVHQRIHYYAVVNSCYSAFGDVCPERVSWDARKLQPLPVT